MPLPIPVSLLDALEGSEGFDRAAFLKVHADADNLTSIRYNEAKSQIYPGDIPGEQIPWNPLGYYLPMRPAFTMDPALHAGLYYVQEAGSQFLWQALVQLASREAPVKVLDLCAAPGGKTTLLASYFKNGLIVANEVIKSRAAVLAENVIKWGSGNIIVTNNDPKHFQRLQGYFDVILVDAPCSGSGLFRKDNHAIEHWSAAGVEMCSKRQQRILQDVMPALKEGGLLLYATCSYSTQEDESIMDWLTDSGNFSLENRHIATSKDWGVTSVHGQLSGALDSVTARPEGYKFYPDKARSEGFFLGAFRKTGPEHAVYSSQNKLEAISKTEASVVYPWLLADADKDLFLFKQGAEILAIGNKWAQELDILQKNLFLKMAGVRVGEIKKKGLVPAHDLAVSQIRSRELPSCALDRAQSLQYLKRQDLNLEAVSSQKGWVLATYNGLGLGWMKLLANRVNNYYPTGWRILKD